jgi:hypothetical protein
MRLGTIFATIVGLLSGVAATLLYSRRVKRDSHLRAHDDQ